MTSHTWNIPNVYAGCSRSSDRPLSSWARFWRPALTSSDPSGSRSSKSSNGKPPPLDFAELRPQVEEDLGAPLDELFAAVDTTPLAAASLAQVHRATLKDGTQVVLKIQRPGIRPTIESDMRLLTHLASLAERSVPQLAAYRPQKVVQQFVKSLQSELNFTTEGHNAEHVAANFEGQDHIVIPKIYWEWTKERINVQEFVDGIPGVDVQAIDAAGMDRKRIAQ